MNLAKSVDIRLRSSVVWSKLNFSLNSLKRSKPKVIFWGSEPMHNGMLVYTAKQRDHPRPIWELSVRPCSAPLPTERRGRVFFLLHRVRRAGSELKPVSSFGDSFFRPRDALLQSLPPQRSARLRAAAPLAKNNTKPAEVLRLLHTTRIV